jgi:hypothetical protein
VGLGFLGAGWCVSTGGVRSRAFTRAEGYSRRFALILDSSGLGREHLHGRSRDSGYRRGSRTVGITGQVTMTTAGVVSVSTSSIDR